jgi:hypothetical protein
MAAYSAITDQTVNPGESVIFTTVVEPCNRGFVRHRNGSGSFLLSGWVPRTCNCRNCNCQKTANYLVNFGANIGIPTGGTAGPITLAIQIDGSTVGESVMEVTPADVEEFSNVSRAVNVNVWNGCCETVAITNTSDQPIVVRNANIVFSRPDLTLTR